MVCVDDEWGRAMAELRVRPVTVGAPARPRTGGRGHPPVDAAVRSSWPSSPPARRAAGLPGGYNVAKALLAVAPLDARGVAGAGGAGSARHGPRPGAAGRPRAGLPRRRRLRAQARSVAGRHATLRDQAPAGSRSWSARAAIGTRASGSRWARSRPSGRPGGGHRRQPAQRGPAAIRAAVLAGGRAAAGGREIGDRRRPSTTRWLGAGGETRVGRRQGPRGGQTSRGTTRPFDDRTELAAALGGSPRGRGRAR